MSANWIKHNPSSTPSIKTDDDVCRVDAAHISAFFAHTKEHFINASSSVLPQDLRDAATTRAPEELAEVIRIAVAEGIVMDSGWLDHYGLICERVSESMIGYPRTCLAQWDAIKNTMAGRATKRARPRRDSGTHADLKERGKNTKGFPLLNLPDNILARVYSLVIPTGTLTISDWAIGSVPKFVNERGRRTEYEVWDANGEQRRTTYVVHDESPPCGTQLNLMLANRVMSHRLSSMLYSLQLDFRGTASGTLAFLHDHMANLSKLKKVSIRYVTTSKTRFLLGCTYVDPKPPPVLKKNLETWKKILKILLHTETALEDFTLIIDKNFREQAPLWKAGVEAVMRDKALCEPLTQSKTTPIRNFLVDVSRLSGINFWLTMEGIENDQAKAKFARELERDIRRRMQSMPYFAERNAVCRCKKRLLREACAWETESLHKKRG